MITIDNLEKARSGDRKFKLQAMLQKHPFRKQITLLRIDLGNCYYSGDAGLQITLGLVPRVFSFYREYKDYRVSLFGVYLHFRKW